MARIFTWGFESPHADEGSIISRGYGRADEQNGAAILSTNSKLYLPEYNGDNLYVRFAVSLTNTNTNPGVVLLSNRDSGDIVKIAFSYNLSEQTHTVAITLFTDNANLTTSHELPANLTNEWILVQIAFELNTSTSNRELTLYVDEVQVASINPPPSDSSIARIDSVGLVNETNTTTYRIDDLAINDNTSVTENGLPENARVLTLLNWGENVLANPMPLGLYDPQNPNVYAIPTDLANADVKFVQPFTIARNPNLAGIEKIGLVVAPNGEYNPVNSLESAREIADKNERLVLGELYNSYLPNGKEPWLVTSDTLDDRSGLNNAQFGAIDKD